MSALAAVALAAALGAAPVEAGGERLSLEEALALARERNHQLVAARAVLDQSQEGVARARAALLPTLAAVGTYTHNYKEATFGSLLSGRSLPPGLAEAFAGLSQVSVLKQEAVQGSLTLELPLVAPAGWVALSAAGEAAGAARARFEVAEADVLFSAAQAFFAAAGADGLLEARRHAVEVGRATLGAARARLEAGTVNRQEVSRAQLALLNAEQAVLEAEDLRERSYRTLATLLGRRDALPVVAPPEAEEREGGPAPALEVAVARALQVRPELEATRAEVRAAGARAEAEGWRWAPSLKGVGVLTGANFAGFSGDLASWSLGLSLGWLLYDGGLRDAARREAAAAQAEQAARLAQLEATVADDIAAATRALATRRQALGTARRSVALATDTLEVLRSQYQAGAAVQLEVLQAQDALVGSEVQLVQARYDLALAALALRRQVGEFP